MTGIDRQQPLHNAALRKETEARRDAEAQACLDKRFGPPRGRTPQQPRSETGLPPAENVATKTGRRTIANELDLICDNLDLVFACDTGTPRGQSPAQVLIDELQDIADRLRD